jgi:hypothetical protein
LTEGHDVCLSGIGLNRHVRSYLGRLK